ncbi:MAG: DUF2157 domain-containing protein [Desulfobacterales bacterium]|nr:DUF2157 domain-containing protein [Desulfobacterales bacterium]
MKKQINWLFNEIDNWVGEGIVAFEQGEIIKSRYPASGEETRWSRIIFFSIGAILFGLGVILMFAYNWEKMPKFAKLALIFLALAAVHFSAGRLHRPEGKYRVTGEGLYLLGTMLFGAGIWLVAQIYHIQEHYPNAFLIWGLGALALAWALPSTAQGIVAAILLLLWNGFEVFDFKSPQPLSPFLILAGLSPLAWLNRSRVLLATTVCAFLLTLAFSVSKMGSDLVVLVVFFSAASLMAMGLIVRAHAHFPESGPIFRFIGSTVYLSVLFALSFHHRGRGGFSVHFDKIPDSIYFFSFAFAAVALWILAVRIAWPKKPTRIPFRPDDYGTMATLLVILLNTLGLLELRGWVGAAIFNLLFLFHCLMMIVSGCKSSNLKLTATGCLLFAVIAATRYTDLFTSLLARSLVFFLTGAALFAVGLYFSRTKKTAPGKTT